MHIVEMKINANAGYTGKTLLELGWREKFAINIVYIKRGDKLIHVPGRENRLMPFDQIGIIATDAQIQDFKPMFENGEIDNISLQKVTVDEHTKWKGMNIISLALRERTNGIVVGIERNKKEY